MDSALRPMSTSEVLDRTFFLYRKNLLGFSTQNPELSKSPEKLLPLMAGYFLCYGIIYVIGNAVATGATVDAVSRLHLGYPATMAESYKRVFSRFFTVLGIVVLSYLCASAAAVAGEVVASVAVIASFSGIGRAGGSIALAIIGGILALLVFVAGCSGGLYLYCRWCLAVPASLVEGSGVLRKDLCSGCSLSTFSGWLLP